MFEARGRMDMAVQTWQQVLTIDPNNADALGGLARAAKLEGNAALANSYLDRLRTVSPNDPKIGQVEALAAQQSPQQKQMEQLQQAVKLADAGRYAAAMAIYRQVFGDSPPPGEWALAYYETESATEDGRPLAIAGLRALTEKYPEDARYQIALGRILTYDPKTREEGRRLLERYPKDQQADEAVRQSLLWDSADPAFSGEIHAYLRTHPNSQLAAALQTTEAGTQPSNEEESASATAQPPAEPAQSTAPTPSSAVRSATETAAYKALNAKHIAQAEELFKAILAREPENARALAGIGYIRMQQGNFPGAISYLEQARRKDPSDKDLVQALDTSRFWFLMDEGQAALNENNLTMAEKRYRAALALRPTSPEALAGLGGTLQKAQQPGSAVPFYERDVQANPVSVEGWRGLFLAQVEAGSAAQALATDKRIPTALHAQLTADPVYLRALASAYSAVGRDGDARMTLESALQLSSTATVKADMQIQLADILLATNHLEQAATLYSQVLALDHGNTPAWQGLTRAQHAMGHDREALQTVESMPPSNYAAVMRDPGFETTVASVYQAENKLDVAQDLLEKAAAQQTGAGQKPSLGIELQLAGLYVARGDSKSALPIYQNLLTDDASRVDAWIGLLSALHALGQDKEAVAQVQRIPPATRSQLEASVNYLQTMGAVYGALGQSQQALLLLNRVQQYYAAQHTAPPADIDIQNAWLLYNSQNDAGLYRQLMDLGGRPDLSDEQCRSVQAIWTNWAVRRANQSAAAGDSRRALAILNAAARAFPDNPAVLKTLANGYARAGQPERAVLIYKAQNMASASVVDYQAAVGAALAAGDGKVAEIWLHHALATYPNDPRILILGAQFEQARGNTRRAIHYYRASLKAMPPLNPAAELAEELGLPSPSTPSRLPSADQVQDLSILLAPGADGRTPSGGDASGTQERPYLPSYETVPADPYGRAPSVPNGPPEGLPKNAPTGGATGLVPPYMTNPDTQPEGAGKGRPRDNAPQASVRRGAVNLPSQAEVELRVRTAVARVLGEPGPAIAIAPQSTPLQSIPPQSIPRIAAQPAPDVVPQSAVPTQQRLSDVGASMLSAVTVQLGDNAPRPSPPQAEVTDVLPTAHYVANASAGQTVSSHPDIAAAQAADIRRHQSDPDTLRTGQSNPPPEDSIVATEQNAQYSSPQQVLAQNRSSLLVAQPSTPPTGQSNIPDTGTQQYPQPSLAPAPAAAPAQRRRIVRSTPAHAHTPVPAAAPPAEASSAAPQPETVPAPSAAELPPTTSPPSASQPLSGQPYPLLGPPYPVAPYPSYPQPSARYTPPLRGDSIAAEAPIAMTPRQQAESELASLEGSYSSWAGVTGIGRYRSGTPGLDRLYDIEAPVEASAAIGQSVRLTVVALPVFLNSGTLDPSSFTGSNVPYLGTMPANSANPPAQQISNGVGGELQLTTKNLGLAAGYTPTNFLIQNITGRFSLRLLGGRVTLFGDRDPVKDTQLSYAGLRDPQTITPTYVGRGWGGVISSTAGARLDLGSGGSGFYLSGDGGVLHGYHVQNNTKVEGAMGAYLRVKNWPTVGSLTLGGGLYAMHYRYNELGLTFGQGGYFSPHSFFLASVPITFNGFYRSSLHYLVSGAFGMQTFQQDSALFYPLDPGLQADLQSALGCTAAQLTAHTCGQVPVSGNTGFNYAVNSEVSYRFAEHWYLGGFVSGNNTNNYNTVSGGFFFRYAFHKQHSSQGYPTGLFPVEGFRPLRVP